MSKLNKRRVKFQDSWLTLIDPNGTLIPKWAKKDPNDQYFCICIVCKNARFSVDRGIDRLRQHARTEKHIKNWNILNTGQLLLTTTSAVKSSVTMPLQEICNVQTVRSFSLYNGKHC